jgi:fermentation-respiration switch protein FrsA (DUF1100 family)
MTPPAKPSKPWRRSLRLLVWPIGCYLAIIILLLVFENQLVFFPTPASTHWQAPPTDLTTEDVWLQTSDGRMHAWWLPKPGAKNALIYFHGNAGNLSHRTTLAAGLMRAAEASVLIVDYPGYGKSEGKPTEAGCYAVADAAYDWVTESEKIPPERIILFGKSLGGGVATDLASRRPHRALVLAKTFTSVPDMAQQLYPWLPGRWLCRNRFDNLAKIRSCSAPIFVAHGDCDGTIHFSQGERLFDAAGEPKRFLLMPGCNHNDAFPPEFFSSLTDFLKQIGD